MDAFSSYNQILIHPYDQEKTTFITEKGIFCYKVMPFGLKNAGATYQRLVNKIFADMLGTTIEVCIGVEPKVGCGIESKELGYHVEPTWMGRDIELNRSMTWHETN